MKGQGRDRERDRERDEKGRGRDSEGIYALQRCAKGAKGLFGPSGCGRAVFLGSVLKTFAVVHTRLSRLDFTSGLVGHPHLLVKIDFI